MLNVTEKRQLAHQLSHLTALSRAAEQIGSVGTLLLDHHARIVSFCGAFEEWTGFAEKELLQRHVSTIVDRTSQAAIADAAISSMETRRVTTAEVSFLSKSLETIRARVAIAPIIEGFAATGVTIVATKASPS
jgi:PAS domain S-box-containing protein